LIGHIRACVEQLPFRLEDSRELWLFDRDDRQPLALLAASRPGGTAPFPEPKSWSTSLGASGVPSQRRYPDSAESRSVREHDVMPEPGQGLNHLCNV
jgi:hypothetical protein